MSEKRPLIRLHWHRSAEGFGWSVTLLVRGKHRARWNSTKATTPMIWRFIKGADENCNRALTLTIWPIGMLDVWWEPGWRTDDDGPCDDCRAEFTASTGLTACHCMSRPHFESCPGHSLAAAPTPDPAPNTAAGGVADVTTGGK